MASSEADIPKNACGEGLPSDGSCAPSPASISMASTANLQQVESKKNPCGEDLPCDGTCECDAATLLAFVNPDIASDSMPQVCASGECSSACICRDDLLKTAQVVAALKKHGNRYGNLGSATFTMLTSFNSSKSNKDAHQKALADKSEL